MNKKLISIISIIILLSILSIIICRVVNPTNGTLICTYKTNTDIYNISTKYEIKFTDKVVNNLYSEEIIEADDEKMLSEYKTSLDLVYSKYYNLKYYDNSVKLQGNKLISKTNINYQKIDISKFIAIDNNNRKLFTNNKIKVKLLKKTYEEKGARCTYK